jgi:hypothetical protein
LALSQGTVEIGDYVVRIFQANAATDQSIINEPVVGLEKWNIPLRQVYSGSLFIGA